MNTWALASFVLLLFGSLPPARAGERAQPADKAPSRFAKLDDLHIHYHSHGEGKTALVLVHGWSCDLTFWREQTPAFAGKVRLILIDLPGHGQSDRPKIDYTMDLFARAIHAVLTDAGVDQAVLAGHSMGTPVVRQYYRLYPKKTRALIAVDGSFRPFITKQEEIDQFLARFSGPDFKDKLGEFVDGMFKEHGTAETRKAVKETVQKAEQHVAVSAMKNMFDPAIRKDDEIKVPVQAIMAKSPYWTEDYEKYVRKLAPKLDYRVMEGVSHFPMMDKPEVFNEILADFLKKQGVLK